MTMTRAALIGAALAWTSWSHAADLGSGTLNLAETTIQVSGGPVVGTNAGDAAGARCIDPVFPCDTFTLTVELPEDVSEFFPTALVRVTMQPEDNPSTADDYDLFLYDDAGNELASSTSPGGTEGVSTIAFGGSRGYLVEFVHWLVVGGTWSGEMTLSLGAPSEDKTDEEIAAWLEENGGSTTAAARGAAACEEPGLPILVDNTGDQTLTGVPGQDLESLNVFQTKDDDGMDLLGFQLKVDSLAQLTPQTVYFVSFEAFGDVRGVRMEIAQDGAVSYFSYIVSEDSDGDRLGQFVDSAKPAHPWSNYTTDGVITIYAAPNDVLLFEPGDVLTGFNSGVITFVGAEGVGFSLNGDTMPDGLGRQGQYEYLSDEGCAADSRDSVSRAVNRGDVAGGATGLWLLVLAGLLGLRRR